MNPNTSTDTTAIAVVCKSNEQSQNIKVHHNRSRRHFRDNYDQSKIKNNTSPPKLPRRRLDDDDVVEATTLPPSSSSPARRKKLLRPDSVTALLHDFYDDLNSNVHSKSRECWKAFYEKYHAPSYLMVRPSGNPLGSSGFIDLFCCEDIKLLGFRLVSVDHVQILAQGLVAVVIYTVDQTFTYKGTLQQDRCVLTCVAEEIRGDIRIRHEHRSSGQPVIKRDRWEEHTPSQARRQKSPNETKQSVF